MSLNPRQTKFVAAYIKSGNASRAAIEAGYSEHTSTVQGSRLLTNAEILNAVAAAIAGQGVSLERWVKEVSHLALDTEPCDEFTHDHKVKYVDLLGKHLGAFHDSLGSATAFQINIHLGD